MTPEQREQVILNAELDEICNPHTGDCVSVAVALKEVFGGKYLCCYELPSDTRPVHATVEIDGVPFDGSGITSWESLYDNATSGLKKDEIGPDTEHIGYSDELKRNALYDEKTKNEVKRRLEREVS